MTVSKQQVKIMPGQNLIFQPASYVQRLATAGLFTTEGPLEVEIGAGDGSFLVQWARSHPKVNFLGVERLLGRLRKIGRKASRAGLTNVRLMRIEAAYFVEYLLPLTSVSAMHIYFPDPWPKRKQRKNRLIENRFVEAVAQALIPGGIVYLRTDDNDYFEQMKHRFGASRQFESIETPAELRAVLTDFERGFLARGVATLHAPYRRKNS
jgi:tRNA (guanine-N7-)-methyltransferase